MVHECLTDGGIDLSDIDTVMSAFKAKSGKPPQDSSRKIKTQQRYAFARANQYTNHLVDKGANRGLAGADMRFLQMTDRKINIVGIDDHELTSLDPVTAAVVSDTQKRSVIGILPEYVHLDKGKSIHLLDKWNGSTTRLITDPILWEVPRELQTLIDMFPHSTLNLVWFTCTPSGFLLMMIFSNTPMSSSHQLSFGMLLFWTMVLHLPFLRKVTKKLLIACQQFLF